MKISGYKIIWFAVSLLFSGLICRYAYIHPEKFSPLVDLLATIVSILIGVSLAISAVLCSRPSIRESSFANDEERKRVEKILNKDDRTLIEGQSVIFWFYYSTLLLAVIFKLLTSSAESYMYEDMAVKVIASLFAFVSAMALLWSATLPNLLRSISMQRKDFD